VIATALRDAAGTAEGLTSFRFTATMNRHGAVGYDGLAAIIAV
jgi:hypothetical protein